MGRLRTSAAVAAFLLSFCSAARAATYYVATTGSDTNSGTSAAPFKTIKRAVAAVGPGDTIIVRDGTYPFSGAQEAMAVTITKAGTSSAWITLKAENKWKAILDCQMICHSYLNFGTGSAYWKVIGFDITRGYWSGLWANAGGGQNILIQENRIHHIGNRPTTTAYGITGIYTNRNAIMTLDRNVFHDIGRTSHITGNHDHGVYSHGRMTITNNLFYSFSNGWPIQTAAGFSGVIANNTFYGPATAGKSAQVLLWGASGSVVIRNNVFYNTRNYGVGTLDVTVSGTCAIDHNIVYTPGASVIMMELPLPPGCVQSQNKVNVDPMLVNPAPGGDFRLKAGSPAIDAGAAVSGVTLDYAGNKRPVGAALDMGAYEYGASAAPAATPTGCVAAGAAWKNIAFPGQTKPFTAEFDATPAAAGVDGVIGLSNGPAASYSSLAAAVRFNTAGRIDARSGAAYAASSAISYSAGKTYRFRLVVDLPSKKYSAYVKESAGAEQLVGSNLAFRTEQAAVGTLSSLGAFSSAGTTTVCPPALAAAAPADTTAPAITGLSASGVTAAGATISWTTSEPADGVVEYGPTTSYGKSTALATGLTTAHTATLSGLTAGTLYHYRAKSKDAAGNLATSPDGTFTTPSAAAAGCTTSAASWQNVALTAQTGGFTIEFDATPSAAGIDGVMGLSNGPAQDYSKVAAAVRFNTAGRVDARNGSGYAAAAAIPYAAKTTYRFRLVVDLAGKKYSAYVREGSGAEKLIGANYAFRSEQAGATLLNNLASFASTGQVTVCKGALTAAAAPAPSPTSSPTPTATTPGAACLSSGPAWQNLPIGSQTGVFTLELDATPSARGIDGVIGLSNGAASVYEQLAAAVRFSQAGRIEARGGSAYTAGAAITYTPGSAYHFRLVVDVKAKRYSAYVRPPGAAELTLGTNLAFRPETATVSTLSSLATITTGGSVSVCGAAVR